MAYEFIVVCDVIASNREYHIIIGGDFNVDFSRCRLHISLLDSFCDHTAWITRRYKTASYVT